MWVKICGNTNLEDALAAAELGADAVGFVFAPSKRRVTADVARAIGERLPGHVERVGVFAGGDAEEIVATAVAAGVTAVQMHGGIGLDAAGRVLAAGVEAIIHVAHWTVGEDERSDERSAERLARELQGLAAGERVLIDARIGEASGGLGKTFNWGAAKPVLEGSPGLRFIVAGGLSPENVAEAVAVLAPYGVDVASGVESEPGKKDLARLKAFLENARGS